MLIPLGAIAGFVDSSGGGGWGPITTPTLLSTTQTTPRTVIGTVSASEFLVATAASAGFIAGSATSGLDWKVISGLLLGGVVVITNTRTIMNANSFTTRNIAISLIAEGLLTVALAIKAWRREHKLGVERSFFETRN